VRLRSLIALSLVAGCLSWAAGVRAGEPGRPVPTKEQAAIAGKKFREGELFFAKHDYPRAAKLFEEAYSIAPHPDALLNAIDARERAGDLLVAARLCERLRKDYPNDKSANEEVAERIARLTPKLGRLELVVHPGVTAVKVDSEVIGLPAPAQAGALPTAIWWVDPGDHSVSATTTKGPLQRSVNVVAGAKQSVVLEEQNAAPVEPVKPPPPPADDGKPLHPAVFFVGLGLTAGAGGVLAWSGIDTLGAYDDFEAAPTEAALDDGRGRQLRTNILIGVTAGLGAATAAIGIFATEWSAIGGSETALRLDVTPSLASLSGRFQ
jgi:tetratricopeptide (TPR) repeat protein